MTLTPLIRAKRPVSACWRATDRASMWVERLEDDIKSRCWRDGYSVPTQINPEIQAARFCGKRTSTTISS
jgi:hypothetical protein